MIFSVSKLRPSRSTDTALIIHRVAEVIGDKPHNLPRNHGDSAGTQSCKQGRQHIQREDRLQADLHE
ncbi:hypothetical protein WJX77_000172 [Trebouxia sp. C0004]